MNRQLPDNKAGSPESTTYRPWRPKVTGSWLTVVVTGLDVFSLPATLRQPRAWLVTVHSQPISPVSIPFVHEGLPCVLLTLCSSELYERYVWFMKGKVCPQANREQREKSPSSP